jgi:hypothetical protein
MRRNVSISRCPRFTSEGRVETQPSLVRIAVSLRHPELSAGVGPQRGMRTPAILTGSNATSSHS